MGFQLCFHHQTYKTFSAGHCRRLLPFWCINYLSNWKLGGTQNRSGCFGERKKSCLCWESNQGPSYSQPVVSHVILVRVTLSVTAVRLQSSLHSSTARYFEWRYLQPALSVWKALILWKATSRPTWYEVKKMRHLQTYIEFGDCSFMIWQIFESTCPILESATFWVVISSDN